MKKTIFQRVLCILLVISLALGGLWCLDRVLIMKREDGILTMQDFYAQPAGTVDVLLVGNSHSGINIDTATLWNDYGISSYNLWGGVQPLWNSYHFIVEALKYQTPKVIVLEVMATISDYEYSEEQNQIKNTAGMKFSANKIAAVKASAPEDRQLNLLLGFPLYHGRFDELKEEDFAHFPWSDGLENFKGSTMRYGVGNYQHESAEGVTARREIMDKELDYLNRIIALCEEKEIPLMLLKTPSVEKKDVQEIFNTVSDIAAEKALPFVNMNLMDSVLGITPEDYSMDRHMNGSGARKVAHWLGAYLQENYALADHRGEAAYASWEINACQVNDAYLSLVTENTDYFSELRENGRAVLVVKNDPWQGDAECDALFDDLSHLGFPTAPAAENRTDAYLILDSTTGENAPASVEGDAVSFSLDGKPLTVNFEYQDVVLDGKKLTYFGGAEVVLVVYDRTTQQVVDTVSFSSANHYQLCRPEQ